MGYFRTGAICRFYTLPLEIPDKTASALETPQKCVMLPSYPTEILRKCNSACLPSPLFCSTPVQGILDSSPHPNATPSCPNPTNQPSSLV